MAELAALGFRLVGKLANVPGGITSYYQGMLKDNGKQRSVDKFHYEYSRVVKILFTRYDVLSTPISPVLTFAHMQQPMHKRKFTVNDKPQDYNEYLSWNMLAMVFGLPAAAYPLAKTMDELSRDTQIISGHLHDDVTTNSAELCKNISDGFTVPEGYQRQIPVTAPVKVRCTQ